MHCNASVMKFAARSGIVGSTVIMTNYIGLWTTAKHNEYLSKRVKVHTTKPSPLDKMVKTYKNGIEKTVGLLTITPNVVANLAATANNWTSDTMLPMIRELLHGEEQFIKEHQFPDEHGKEKLDENLPLKNSEDCPNDVQKTLPQQDAEQREAMTAVPVGKQNGDDTDNKDDMGIILSALASTIKIITPNTPSTDLID